MLAACFRGKFYFDFFSCTFDVEKEAKGWICRGFHVLSSGVLTRIFRHCVWELIDAEAFLQATELMVLIDLEFIGNSTSPPFASLSCSFHMGMSLAFGKRLIGVFWDTHGCKETKSKSCANANLGYL